MDGLKGELDRIAATLLDLSAKHGLPIWNALGRCFLGMLLLARGDEDGLMPLQDGLEWLREANFVFFRSGPTAAMARGLAAAGRTAEARRHEALSWELRVATSLARLWRDAGKSAVGHELLSGVYGRFTEGFEALDLRTARALIDELAPGQVSPPSVNI